MTAPEFSAASIGWNPSADDRLLLAGDASSLPAMRALLASLPNNRVVVVGPVAAPSRADAVGRVDATLAELCAEYGVAYIDASAWSLSYLPDRLHLTQSGHMAFGQRVADELVARGLLG